MTDYLYSRVADEQLDALENASDIDLYNSVLDACHLVFDNTASAQALSTVITTDQGLILVLPVAGHPPYKVFWSSDEPRIEAVFPRP